MHSLETDKTVAKARQVEVSASHLIIFLVDGRKLSVPLEWFPRLVHGNPSERIRYELIGGGTGIHWPLLDEDISVEGLLAGHRSGESPSSIKRWLAARSNG